MVYKTTCRIANAHDATRDESVYDSEGKMYDQSNLCVENMHIERTQVVIFRCTALVSTLTSLGDDDENVDYNEHIDDHFPSDSTRTSTTTAGQRGLVFLIYLYIILV